MSRQPAPGPNLFPGFRTERIAKPGATIHTVVGGSGPPLLLIHGYPQTHAEWHKIAGRLAQHFTVVMTDLRGYGDSSKPADGENHAGYSKRAMALDQVAVMRALGFDRFALRCFRDPATIHATCEDYRAGATIDIEHAREDGDRKVTCPLLVLWGDRGTVGRLYDVMSIWRQHAVNVSGKGLPAGHFLPEEVPDETLAEVLPFLQAGV